MKNYGNRQRGAVLIISLMLLIVLTLIGLASMQNTSLEERMAGNMRSENVAFQAAESALRDGEEWLATRIAEPAPDNGGTTGVWALDTPDASPTDDKDWWQQNDPLWWANNGVAFGTGLQYSGSSTLSDPPRYVVEFRGVGNAFGSGSMTVGQPTDLQGKEYFYQVTARGKDMSQRVEAVLRSTFARRY